MTQYLLAGILLGVSIGGAGFWTGLHVGRSTWRDAIEEAMAANARRGGWDS